MANTDDLIREAARNGEEYLRAQIQIALAADQRAISLGGILIASASVVLGFLFGGSYSLAGGAFYLCLILSLGLCIASVFAFFAARPVDVWVPGNRPSSWDEDIENDTPFLESMKEYNKHIDEQIVDNGKIIRRNAFLLKVSMGVSAGVVLISVFWGAGLAFGGFQREVQRLQPSGSASDFSPSPKMPTCSEGFTRPSNQSRGRSH